MKTHEWEEPIKAAHNKRLAFSIYVNLHHTTTHFHLDKNIGHRTSEPKGAVHGGAKPICQCSFSSLECVAFKAGGEGRAASHLCSARVPAKTTSFTTT